MTTLDTTRRDLLRAGAAGAATLLVGGILGCKPRSGVASADTGASASGAACPALPSPRQDLTMTHERQDALTPAAALALLKDGNQRFLNGSRYLRDTAHDREVTSHAQYPFAAVLGCIDSRAPAEIVFDSGIGDIFNARVAGNIADADILGSLEYSCKVAGAKVVLVVGHSSCGAIKGACDNVKLGNLTGLLARIQPSVKAVHDVSGPRNSSNHEFVEAVARQNVRQSVKNILAMSPILREMQTQGHVLIVGSMLDLETGKVDFYDTPAAA